MSVAVPTVPKTPVAPKANRPRLTEDRILAVALDSFSRRGFDATSLDALAAELGVTKQAILYHYASKKVLLEAVIDRACFDLIIEFDGALSSAGSGWERIERLVRTMFRVGVRRPELMGLVREVSRLGGDAAARLSVDLQPFVERATSYFQREMDAGTIRQCDPSMLLMLSYSAVIGIATDMEVLRIVGMEPTLRSAAVRRRELLSFLKAAMSA